MRVVFHEARPAACAAFVAAGYKASLFFPHRVHRLPKCGPDGMVLAQRMCGVADVSQLWQLVLFATPPAIDEFPLELFFDRELLWHEQHLNRPGQVGSVDLVERDGVLFTMAHQSDLVQRISRRRDLKTRVEKVFKGWHHLLLNAIGGFALDRGIREIRVPTSALAMKHTDAKRTVQPELFARVYDRAVRHHFAAHENDGWWCIDVAANRRAIVPLVRGEESLVPGRTACVCHDVERGYGHRLEDAAFAQRADDESPAALDRMLAIERQAGIRATYNVVGSFLPEVREQIEGDGHALAFHSFDHDLSRDQLARCRKVDYRLKGYRPPQSRLTAELGDERLYQHNVEWLASSGSSLGVDRPAVVDRLVKIPIAFDDFKLYRGQVTFDTWRRTALERIAGQDFTAFSLHDCYAGFWLDAYQGFIEDVKQMARTRTLNEVASDLYLASGI